MSVLHRLELRGNLLILSGTAFLLGLVTYAWFVVLPLHMRDLGATELQVGTAYGLFALVAALAQLPGGWLTDHLGRRRMIVAGNVGVVAGLALAAAARTWPVLIAGLLLYQGIGGLQWPSFLALIGESTQRRGRAYASFYLSWATGTAIGPLLGAGLLPRFGVPPLIAATAAANLLVAVVRWRTLEDLAPPERPRLDLGLVLRPKVLRTVAVGLLAEALVSLTVFGPFVALYAGQVGRHTKSDVNLMLATGTVASIAAALLLGGLVDRIGSRRVLWSAYLLHAGLLLGWALTGAPWWSVVLLAPAYAAQTLGSSAYNAFKMSAGDEEARGMTMGVIGTTTAAGSAVAPIAAAVAAGLVGPLAPFALALAVAASIRAAQALGERAG